jgi:hypothetical protein
VLTNTFFFPPANLVAYCSKERTEEASVVASPIIHPLRAVSKSVVAFSVLSSVSKYK